MSINSNTHGPGALAPEPQTEAQANRRSFRLVSYDERHRQEHDELAEMQEIVDANEEIDWQLFKWMRVSDSLRDAKARLDAAKEVYEHYSSQLESLTDFLKVECREKYLDLISREHKGKTKYTDHPLILANRRDLIVRVQSKTPPELPDVFDETLLVNHGLSVAAETGEHPAWLKWVEPTEGYFTVAKAEINKAYKAGENLPGVSVIQKPEQIYFEDKSRKDGK